MNPRNSHPIEFFNEWFAEPFQPKDTSVAEIVSALTRHPLANDETAQEYVMPVSRCREYPGRFRIYGENQDVFYCFVYEREELKIDPPVYFESCLDLHADYGIDQSDIIKGDHVLVCGFSDFLWQILGRHICLRTESSGQFSTEVTGIVCDEEILLDHLFVNQLGREFPAGHTCFVSEDVVCIPDWGAAFRTVRSRDLFISRYSPSVSRHWS